MIKFGPSGNSESFYALGYKTSEQAPAWLSSMGLTAYEYSFGRGVNISERKAELIKIACEEHGVEVSVHAPYYINFANPSDEMVEKSFGYLFKSADVARHMGAKRIVFHSATVGKMTRDEAFSLTRKRMEIFLERVHNEGYGDMIFCPETMGKINQIGTLEEVIELCKMSDVLYPAVDFGHLNARSMGRMNSEKEYAEALDIIESLGGVRAKEFHVHFSKIEYSKGGEVRHLTFEDKVFGPDFDELAKLLAKRKLEPKVLCESDGTQAEDALTMLKIYNSVANAEQEV